MQKETQKWLVILVGGFVSVLLSYQIFPKLPEVSLSFFIAELLFEPFKLLVSVLFFIIGFLAHAYIIRKVLAKVQVERKAITPLEWLFIVGIGISYLILIIVHSWLVLAALVLAVLYGTMDVDLERKKGKRRDSN